MASYNQSHCSRGSYVESSESLEESEVGLDRMSKKAQVDDEFLVTNMEMGADGDEPDRNIGLQQLLIGYCTNSITLINSLWARRRKI